MQVTKRDGKVQSFNDSKIKAQIKRACKGLADVSSDEIFEETMNQTYDGIPTYEIDKASVFSARSKIEKDPNYSYVAARLFLNILYKEVFGTSVNDEKFEGLYRQSFIDNLKLLVQEGRIDPRVLELDLEGLSKELILERDFLLTYLSVQTLYDRYFIHLNERRLETPQAFWMRVAIGLCLNDRDKIKEVYQLISSLEYLPSTPTLFNSCTTHPQLSSCYISTLEDSIDGIFGTIHGQARLSKHAGGLGVDWTPVRATNSWIKGTNGPSQGLIPWLKIFNDTLIAVNQGSKRKGAGCAYLETWHLDIEDFLELRKNTGDDRRRCHDMNTANWIPDYFMECVEKDNDWYLFSPDETPDLHELYGNEFTTRYINYVQDAKEGRLKLFKVVKAKQLWKKMLTALSETGHPWITFKDSSNIRYTDKHQGVIHSTQLCTEIFRHTKPSTWKDGIRTKIGETAVCNLGSLNLARHYKNGKIDYDKLAQNTKLAVRILDNVIDLNFYPTDEARNSNMLHRPVGLGIMGLSDLLHKEGIAFESDEAVNLSDKLQEFISYHAISASAELAKERGSYSTFRGSAWSQGQLPIFTYSKLNEYRPLEEFDGTTYLSDVSHYGPGSWVDLQNKVRGGMRNSCLMAIAPTATISYIAGCSASIEPDFALMHVYSTLSGEFTMVNEYFVKKMKKLGLWGEEMVDKIKRADGDVLKLDVSDAIKSEFKGAFDIDWKFLIKSAAMRQKWIDMGQSLNLYTRSKSLKNLHNMYFYAWKTGLKSTYYLRTKGASQVEKSSMELKECRVDDPTCEACQ